jgi:serine/threonine protein kinase
MKIITVNSFLSTNLYPEFQTIQTIEIEDKPMADGAFGDVYVCTKLNGVVLKRHQVIKIFKEDSKNRQDHNFETIKKLQKKIDSQNQNTIKHKKTNIIDEVPGLKGIPQFSFVGTLSNKQVRGFSSNNLKELGFQEFNEILNNEKLRENYQLLSIGKKIEIAYHFVTTFKLLNDIYFIHADLKPEALFINTITNECAIIDYDSGVVIENANDTPNVWGSPSDWVAPEIWEQLKQQNSSDQQIVKVNLLSDMWSVCIGIHYILTTVHPLLYLTELSPRVINPYFSNYKWPYIKEREPYFNTENKGSYKPIVNWLVNVLPKQIFKEFERTINYGYKNPIKRTTYNEWKRAFHNVLNIPVKILSFSPSTSTILLGEDVTFEWQIENEHITELNGMIVTGQNQIVVTPTQTTDYVLVAKNLLGQPVTATKRVVVNKPPVIQNFSVSATDIAVGQQVTFSWLSEEHTELYLSGNKLAAAATRHTVTPTKPRTTWVLVAKNAYGEDTSKVIEITTHKAAELHKFESDKYAITDDETITLTWKATRMESFVLEWRVYDETISRYREETITLPPTDFSHTLDLKGSEKRMSYQISLTAKSKYGDSQPLNLKVIAVQIPKFEFEFNKMEVLPQIMTLALNDFPVMPNFPSNSQTQELAVFKPYPTEYTVYARGKNSRRLYWTFFFLSIAIVSAVTGFFFAIQYYK